ncbi:NAD-dependent epimerase/dehydratase family protein [Yinghuangia sp. ASG 101]|uniref:NAD-dependent epimerase/dehydratase family protein n=1 Tax=Yinghuangia sp. ASG 101 TaxID=2896848 RepID=UPI001E34DE9E|nr:NAD-dependent epimerase/dehydratase family protein [Yinghuangia sp. ASG 101]UGQ10598.1 NAD-dependent epimerase/dehydratase family protein [Yinghuangia sp. ASG 101]
MKVVVTGGAGFIGSNLARALLARSEVGEVAVVDDLSTGSLDNLAGVGVTFHQGSFLDEELMDKACAGTDAIVHLGALPSVPRSIEKPLASHHANATGTLMVLEAARRAGGAHVIAASSSSVYGGNPVLPKREDLRTLPLSPYAVSKLATESYVLAYGHCYGLPVLPFRFFNVFGPLQAADHAYAAVIPRFIDAALAGRVLTVHGDGEQTRDFTNIGSVCTVLTDAVVRRVTNTGPVNLAFGTRTSLNALIGLLSEVLGRPVDVEHVAPRAGDVRDSQADSSELRRLFPDARPVELRRGLADTVAWFRSRVAVPARG